MCQFYQGGSEGIKKLGRSRVGQVVLSGDRIALGVPRQCIASGGLEGFGGRRRPVPGLHVLTINLNLICI